MAPPACVPGRGRGRPSRGRAAAPPPGAASRPTFTFTASRPTRSSGGRRWRYGMRWWRVAMASGQELDRRCSAPASPSRERRRRPRGRWLWECDFVLLLSELQNIISTGTTARGRFMTRIERGEAPGRRGGTGRRATHARSRSSRVGPSGRLSAADAARAYRYPMAYPFLSLMPRYC